MEIINDYTHKIATIIDIDRVVKVNKTCRYTSNEWRNGIFLQFNDNRYKILDYTSKKIRDYDYKLFKEEIKGINNEDT